EEKRANGVHSRRPQRTAAVRIDAHRPHHLSHATGSARRLQFYGALWSGYPSGHARPRRLFVASRKKIELEYSAPDDLHAYPLRMHPDSPRVSCAWAARRRRRKRMGGYYPLSISVIKLAFRLPGDIPANNLF